MGCESSKPNPPKAAKIPSQPNFGKKEGLNPKDYIFTGRHQETLIKNPGQIDGQQFIVEDCDDCDIFVLDHIGALTIDYCKNCRIVTGPVSSSIDGHFQAAGLDAWNNNWHDVYDFTPEVGNYRLLPPTATHITTVPKAEELVEQGLAPIQSDRRYVIASYGSSYPYYNSSAKHVLLCVPVEFKHEIREAVEKIAPCTLEPLPEGFHSPLSIDRSILKKLTLAQVSTLVGGEKAAKKYMETIKQSSPCLFLVVQITVRDESSLRDLEAVLRSTTPTADNEKALSRSVLMWNDTEAQAHGKTVFELWKEQT